MRKGKVFGEQELLVDCLHSGSLRVVSGVCRHSALLLHCLLHWLQPMKALERTHVGRQNGVGRPVRLAKEADDGVFTRRQTGHRQNIIIIIGARCVPHPTSFELVFCFSSLKRQLN